MTNPRIRDFAPVGNPNAGRHKVGAAIHKLMKHLTLTKVHVKEVRVDIGYDTIDRHWNAWVTSTRTNCILASAIGRNPENAADNLMELFPEFFSQQ